MTLLEPWINAVMMKYVTALQFIDLIVVLQLFNTDRTAA